MQYWTFTYTIGGHNFGYQRAFSTFEKAKEVSDEFQAKNNAITGIYLYPIEVIE